MISGNFAHCTDLLQFYDEITELQEGAHGEGYCDVHTAIIESLNGNAKRYIELGINQGATLALALVHCKIESAHAFDINIDRFDPYRSLFEEWCTDYKFSAEKALSTDPKIVQECDVLYIDTLHMWPHLNKELDLWNEYVTETIICHDTHAHPAMRKGIDSWLKNHDNWKLHEHNTLSVGYSVIKRVNT